MGDPHTPHSGMFMRQDTFERHLDLIRRRGYSVLPLSAAIEGLQGNRPLPPSSVVITIDDGWYGTYKAMMPALVKRNLPATLYCDTCNLTSDHPVPHIMAHHFAGEFSSLHLDEVSHNLFTQVINLSLPVEERLKVVDQLRERLGLDRNKVQQNGTFNYMTSDQLREFFANPLLDVQLHTQNHSLGDFTATTIREEVEQNREALSKLLNIPIEHFRHFCYPSGLNAPNAGEVLASLHIESSTTLASNIAFPNSNLQYLPRLTDGDHLTDIQFEAQLSGFTHLCHTIIDWMNRAFAMSPRTPRKAIINP